MSDPAAEIPALLSSLKSVLAGFTQTNRLLRLHTPLGEDVLLAERLQGIETVSGLEHGGSTVVSGFRLEIVALSTIAALAPEALLGHRVRLDLLTDRSPHSRRPFHGHVTAMELLGSNGGFVRYRLVVEPWLALLRQRRDSYVFQNQTIVQIVDEVFGDYAGQGQLVPAWRWQLSDAEALPVRSLCIQHAETDHDFVLRLLAEEGLFFWFEHSHDTHSCVIADRKEAFGQAGPEASGGALGAVRYQRAAATEAADTLQHFAARASLGTQAVELASWDYVSLGTRPASYNTLPPGNQQPELAVQDHVGSYAYPDRRQGERLARCRAEALATQRGLIDAAGTVRWMGAGSTFLLEDHPRYHRLRADDASRAFAVVRIEHQSRNNLPADFSAALDRLFAAGSLQVHADTPEVNCSNSETPLYHNVLRVHPLSQPFAPATPLQRPRVSGSLTATVVSTEGAPLTTDRDHRIRLQFHFQRGGRASSHKLHPSGSDNAMGDASSSTWVRVASPLAGPNWGGHFVPRAGQEVLVQFLDGDIDRPVVTGTLYNGQGSADAVGNAAAQAAPAHSANAPAWFAGNAHGAVFSGLKSMALGASTSGQGGYNHLRFDDTPTQSSTQLASTLHASTLTLGHHRGQDHGGEGLAGNVRTQGLGHGASLLTAAFGSLRGGTGLLLSADARAAGGFASAAQMDAKEAVAQLSQAQQLSQSLIETALHQQTNGPTAEVGMSNTEHAVISDNERMQADLKTCSESRSWARPHLAYSAPGGLCQLTSGGGIYSSGGTWHSTASIGSELLAQGAARCHAVDGIRLFTVGAAAQRDSALTERGMRMHAASGQLCVQAHRGEACIAAKQNVGIASVSDLVSVHARGHVLMTAMGAYLKVEGNEVQLHAPGQVALKAGKKVLTGPESTRAKLPTLPRSQAPFRRRDSYPFSA